MLIPYITPTDLYSDAYKILYDKIGDNSNVLHFGDEHSKFVEVEQLLNSTGKTAVIPDINHQQNIITIHQPRKNDIIRSIIYAIYLQKPVGYTIICVDEIYNQFIIDVLYLLCTVFQKVQVVHSSHKYIICKNITINTIEIQELAQKISQIPDEDNLYRILTLDIPYHFIVCLEEMNAMFGQNQIEKFSKKYNIR